MSEKPILFSAPMVRAILAGTKTQTRRLVKPQPSAELLSDYAEIRATRGIDRTDAQMLSDCLPCPYGEPGTHLWVRETWAYGVHAMAAERDEDGPFVYAADGTTQGRLCDRWRPSIHMPRATSRITLEVTGVRVERLQDISEADAMAEGCNARPFPGPWWQGYMRRPDGELMHQQVMGETPPEWMIEPHQMKAKTHLDVSARDEYRNLWNSINGPDSWQANPWVWVVEFRRAKP